MTDEQGTSAREPTGQEQLQLTKLISAASEGDEEAQEQLYARSYQELRTLAGIYMRRVPLSDTLQPTALVNEAYLRVASREKLSPQNSREFFGILSRAMRDILVEQARKHGTQKRGEGWTRIVLSVDELSSDQRELDISPVALSEALSRLHESEPDLEELVRLRFFAGLGLRAVAKLQGVSLAKVRQDWEFARAWLRKELVSTGEQETGSVHG